MECFINICRITTIKKKLLDNNLIYHLISYCLLSLEKKEKEHENDETVFNAFKLLFSIMDDSNKYVYIPGETKETQKIRKYMIEKGAFICLLFMNKFSENDKIKNFTNMERFLNNLTIEDLELQEEIFSEQINQNNSENLNNDNLNFDKYKNLEFIKFILLVFTIFIFKN